MAKRPDMQVVGEKITHLRREKRLCAVAFSQEIGQPAWLVMLLESAYMEQSKRLSDLLPDSVIAELLQKVCEVYGVSHRWLTTRYQSPKHPPLQEAEPRPEPLLLPITFTPEDAISILDDLIDLALPDPHFLLQHDDFFQQSIQAVSMLYKLQLAQLEQNGSHTFADQQRKEFKRLLNQRASHWKEQLNIADIAPSELTSA